MDGRLDGEVMGDKLALAYKVSEYGFSLHLLIEKDEGKWSWGILQVDTGFVIANSKEGYENSFSAIKAGDKEIAILKNNL